MRRWSLNPVRYGVLNMDGSIVVGVVEIRMLLHPTGLFQAALTMSPNPVGRSDATITADPADSKNGAMRNLTEVIDRFPIFDGKIT